MLEIPRRMKATRKEPIVMLERSRSAVLSACWSATEGKVA